VVERILIVEDEAVLRKHLARLFVREGYDVRTAESCAAARGELRASRFETLLVDVALPDGSGLDLLAELGEWQRPRRTVVMTAFTGLEYEARAHRLNVCCLLRKPVDLAHLVSVVRGNPPSLLARLQE
jgi:DNA-binding NtrC family response regulator